jgi:Secretion system C-terminal sorting domain
MKQVIFTFIAILWFSMAAHAQIERCYTYDAAGNRTQRIPCCSNCPPPPAERSDALLDKISPQMMIVPNPNNGVFIISTEGIPHDAKVTIIDIAGSILVQGLFGDGYFNISDYPTGTYMVCVTHGITRSTMLFEKLSQ